MASINPMWYRGYYYDAETGFYYLQSRYYDPEIGRFINSDSFMATGQGMLGNNMFAYCQNNPICYTDKTGYFLCWAIGAALGGLFGALDAYIQGKTGDEFWASVASGATTGLISGLAADVLLVTGGSAVVVVGVMATAGAVGTVVGDAVESGITGKPMDWKSTAINAVTNAGYNALFAYMGGAIPSQTGSVAQKGFFRVAKAMIIKEVSEIGQSVAEETLSTITTGLFDLCGKAIRKLFKDAWAVCKG